MSEKHSANIELIIISGLSGSGKTVALRTLEDIGYFCIDNLPLKLLETFLITVNSKYEKIGVGVDIREGESLHNVYSLLSILKDRYNVEILFFEADKEVLIRRYKETRRPHPLRYQRKSAGLEDSIEEEKDLLAEVRQAADKIIDTSNYSPHQLRKFISLIYGDKDAAQGLSVMLISFGYKYGVPENIDLLFDIRFLPNPYFIPELKSLKGTDKDVSDFVLTKVETREFLSHITNLLDFLLPHYINEGRSYLAMAIGCTGGRHRSPAIAEEIYRHLLRVHNIKPEILHRDMG